MEANTSTKPETTPTKEEILQHYKEQVEIVELRARIAKGNRDVAMSDYERLQALIMTARLQQNVTEGEGKAPEKSNAKKEPKLKTEPVAQA